MNIASIQQSKPILAYSSHKDDAAATPQRSSFASVFSSFIQDTVRISAEAASLLHQADQSNTSAEKILDNLNVASTSNTGNPESPQCSLNFKGGEADIGTSLEQLAAIDFAKFRKVLEDLRSGDPSRFLSALGELTGRSPEEVKQALCEMPQADVEQFTLSLAKIAGMSPAKVASILEGIRGGEAREQDPAAETLLQTKALPQKPANTTQAHAAFIKMMLAGEFMQSIDESRINTEVPPTAKDSATHGPSPSPNEMGENKKLINKDKQDPDKIGFPVVPNAANITKELILAGSPKTISAHVHKVVGPDPEKAKLYTTLNLAMNSEEKGVSSKAIETL